MNHPVGNSAFENYRAWLIRIRKNLKDWRLDAESPPFPDLPVVWLSRPAQTENAPSILVTAGTHGDEPAGTLALMNLWDEEGFSQGIHWTIIPCLNPSGLCLGTRENAQGIDLNRDFKRCQTAEIQWLVEQYRNRGVWDAHLSLHEDWEFPGFYLYELNGLGVRSLAPELLSVASNHFSLVENTEIDGHTLSAPGYILHETVPCEPEGWPEAIYIANEKKTVSYTCETPSKADLYSRVHCHMDCVKNVAEALVEASSC